MRYQGLQILKTVCKYAGYIFILFSLFILAVTFYVYHFFNRKAMPAESMITYQQLSSVLVEYNFLISLFYVLILVAGIAVIKNRQQKMIAAVLIIMAYLLYAVIDPNRFL